jgi:hypothetical protein
MATRKQRARRAKAFRHEYGFVTYDEDGNEVEVDRSEIRPKTDAPAKPKAAAAQKSKAKSGRMIREPAPPSWNRSLRRTAIFAGPIAIAIAILFFRTTPIGIRILIGLVYAALFVPFTYWSDGMVYRRYQNKKAARDTPRPRGTR